MSQSPNGGGGERKGEGEGGRRSLLRVETGITTLENHLVLSVPTEDAHAIGRCSSYPWVCIHYILGRCNRRYLW